MKMNELKDLSVGRVAELAREVGFASVREMANGLSLWKCDVTEVEAFLEEQLAELRAEQAKEVA